MKRVFKGITIILAILIGSYGLFNLLNDKNSSIAINIIIVIGSLNLLLNNFVKEKFWRVFIAILSILLVFTGVAVETGLFS